MVDKEHDMVGVVPVHVKAQIRHELRAYRVRIRAKNYSDAIERLLKQASSLRDDEDRGDGDEQKVEEQEQGA